MLLGLGVGVALGFLLGEFAGPAAARAVRRRGRPDERTPGPSLTQAAQSALDDDVKLRDCDLKVIGVGRKRIELHGWVPDRRSRARAAHLVSDAVSADAIINCLLVRGEDDLAPEIDETDDEMFA
jgi:hypothetical protein